MPLQYLRDTWQAILNELRREDLRNLKRDTLNFTAPIRFTAAISPAQITGDQNNYAPAGLATANVVRVSTDAPRSITGLAAVTGGGLLLFLNVGSFNLTLVNESASSTAANRFAIGADALVADGHGTLLWFDATSSRWRIVGRSNAVYG